MVEENMEHIRDFWRQYNGWENELGEQAHR